MTNKASNIQVKKLNRKKIFHYINGKEKISMPEIAIALGISNPTVLQITKELIAEKIVGEAGEFSSTGGRKAKVIVPLHNAYYAVGVDITKNHLSLVITNLSKEVVGHIRIQKAFACTEEYYAEIGDKVNEFIKEHKVPTKKVLGVGISLAGIVDSVKNEVTYSHMLNVSNLAVGRFAQYISYPCTLINDANAAALTEVQSNMSASNKIYLSLSNSVGGAVIVPQVFALTDKERGDYHGFQNIYVGDNWRSGEIGHMTINVIGEKCYCGRKGCMDVYCAATNLAKHTDGKLELFFEGLENGNEEYQKIWNEYLDYLVIAVENLRMCFDCDIVLGGYVGSLMGNYLGEFKKRVAEYNIFGETGDYVGLGRYQVEASALGAAIYYIEKFIDQI